MRLRSILAGLLLLTHAGISWALPKMDPISLAQKISTDSSCSKYKIIGVCRSMGVAIGYRVSMNVPVAFVETLGAPGDTLLAAPNFASLIGTIGKDLKVGQSNMSGTDNSFEAKVWNLPDSAMLLSRIMPKCLTCVPSDSWEPVQEPVLPTAGCDLSAEATSKLLGWTQSVQIPFFPKLAYASELDYLNWRTGCRDMTFTKLLQSNAFTCSAEQVAQQTKRLLSRFGSTMPTLRGLLGEACLGSWGTLYPRQMRDIGNVASVASAKTAYRALHVARKQLNAVQYPVDTEGKMSQAYPAVSACFKPGQLPLPNETNSSQPVKTSSNGAYGWIYWRPATCCVSYTTLAQCAQSVKN